MKKIVLELHIYILYIYCIYMKKIVLELHIYIYFIYTYIICIYI